MTAPVLRRVTPTAYRVLPADADRGEWLTARRAGIGASDVPAILDLPDAWGTAVHVYRDKRGELADDAGEAALWGNLNEPTIAREWQRRQRSVIQRVGLVARVDQPWAMTTLDRMVLECPLDREVKTRCALEVKTRSAFKAGKWGGDAVPDDVFAQAVWQRWVTGYDHIHVAVLIGGNELKMRTVFHDPDVEAHILAAVNRFRDEHLLPGVEPAWDLSKADRLIDMDSLAHPDRVGELSLAEVDAVIEYAERSRAKSAATKALKESAARLRQLAAGAEVVKFADELAYGYRETSRRNVDLEVLKAKYPKAYAECVTVDKSHTVYIGAEFKKMGA